MLIRKFQKENKQTLSSSKYVLLKRFDKYNSIRNDFTSMFAIMLNKNIGCRLLAPLAFKLSMTRELPNQVDPQRQVVQGAHDILVSHHLFGWML